MHLLEGRDDQQALQIHLLALGDAKPLIDPRGRVERLGAEDGARVERTHRARGVRAGERGIHLAERAIERRGRARTV